MKKTTLISLAGLALLPLSNASYADYDGNQKTYAGSGCELFFKNTAEDISKNYSSTYANTEALVRCPIVRDNVSNWDGTKAAYVFVEKEVPGTGGSGANQKDVYCALSSYPDTGATGVRGEAVEQKSDRTLEERAGLFSLNVDVNASRPGGTYVLICNLPPRSWIHSYIIAEY